MSYYDRQVAPNRKATAKMPKEMLENAIRLFSVPSTGNETHISLFLIKELETIGVDYEIDILGNFLITKGNAENYPCFVAHLDTVHRYDNGYHISVKSGRYLKAHDDSYKPVGCGGDDKAGINVCLNLLRELDAVKIAFFTAEETGGTGSSYVDLKFFDSCRFIASIDRWGGKDIITDYFGTSVSQKFKSDTGKLLKRFGYKRTSGFFTDCFNLQERDVGVSCFNLSCGYYEHHSSTEYMDMNENYLCYLLCLELAELRSVYKHYSMQEKYSPKVSPKVWVKGKNGEWDWADDDETTCKDCGIGMGKSLHDTCSFCRSSGESDRISCARCGEALYSGESIRTGICDSCYYGRDCSYCDAELTTHLEIERACCDSCYERMCSDY